MLVAANTSFRNAPMNSNSQNKVYSHTFKLNKDLSTEECETSSLCPCSDSELASAVAGLYSGCC